MDDLKTKQASEDTKADQKEESDQAKRENDE